MPRVKLTDEQKQLSIERNRVKTLERYYQRREERIAKGEVIKQGRPRKIMTEEEIQYRIERNRQLALARRQKIREERIARGEIIKIGRPKLSEQSQLISCNA